MMAFGNGQEWGEEHLTGKRSLKDPEKCEIFRKRNTGDERQL